MAHSWVVNGGDGL